MEDTDQLFLSYRFYGGTRDEYIYIYIFIYIHLFSFDSCESFTALQQNWADVFIAVRE